ncbi:MAG: DUF4124 domain-containing protein [Cocleimonas sp.]
MKKLTIYTTLALSFSYLSVDAAYYRWTDDTGQTHYSYSVPQSNAHLGHTELSKQGIRTKKVISAKRNKQLKELEKIRKARKRQAAEKQKKIQFQEEEDSLLLSVFSSEKELTKAYESKLKLAQVTIDLLKSRHKAQSEKLEILEHRYEKLVEIKYKQAMEKQIDVVLDNLKIYQQAITENIIEKDKVRAEFRKTLNRFKKLVARNVSEIY